MEIEQVKYSVFREQMEKMTPANKKRLSAEDIDMGDFYLAIDDTEILGGFNILENVGLLSDVFGLVAGMGEMIVAKAVKLGGTVVVIPEDSKFLEGFYSRCGFGDKGPGKLEGYRVMQYNW